MACEGLNGQFWCMHAALVHSGARPARARAGGVLRASGAAALQVRGAKRAGRWGEGDGTHVPPPGVAVVVITARRLPHPQHYRQLGVEDDTFENQ
eukprot:7648502-Pyramimonas_sp.AAC.1